ncbi:4Fe-4S binding protein [Marivirga sp. S37H4]|uniref:4Fe-4S binding protein n=1 Tax=Marivirga aurantiaca TaxID=2802615 RepID=A0A934WXM6_9BACT|nr:4Fe-4S binding protein [Marivirga aurantiaca]MBK6264695.1 4Fe-4S binding protein [Marivirga aurantiaca]
MKKLKAVHKAGLIIFLIGFGFFMSMFFIGEYHITKEVLQNQLGEDRYEKTAPHFQEMISTTYSSQFTFVSDIKEVFSKINDSIQSRYRIEEGVAEKLAAEASGNVYKQELIGNYYQSNDEISSWKKDKFLSYTDWMQDKKFDSEEALASQLRSSINDINSEIVRSKGYEDANVKNHTTSITKASDKSHVASNPWLWLLLSIILPISGALMYMLPRLKTTDAGIKNDHIYHRSLTSRGWLGIFLGTFLILFYIVLYWYPEYMTTWVLMLDPLSMMLSGNPASRWFLYGFLYTLAILTMGVRMIIKYRHSPYQMARTVSVMFFQLSFAFLIPEILVRLNQPYMDLKNIWPLNYDFFFDYKLNEMITAGTIGIFMLGWGIALIIIAVPLFTYLYGKRWYCSWVCGCGGLAETAGDPYRQLSDKSLKAWKFERISVHSVLVFAVVMTIAVLYSYFTESQTLAGINTYSIRSVYGFAIGSIFAGVIGTGFYPLMGNRVWCRFGCPLAAYIGIIQRFKSKFRITTNGGQCISCGNCSTYCEMGIDVRWYAQRGQNIIRASCVGCGVCSSVCPRGVLNLENKDENGRFNQPILTGNDSFGVTS